MRHHALRDGAMREHYATLLNLRNSNKAYVRWLSKNHQQQKEIEQQWLAVRGEEAGFDTLGYGDTERKYNLVLKGDEEETGLRDADLHRFALVGSGRRRAQILRDPSRWMGDTNDHFHLYVDGRGLEDSHYPAVERYPGRDHPYTMPAPFDLGYLKAVHLSDDSADPVYFHTAPKVVRQEKNKAAREPTEDELELEAFERRKKRTRREVEKEKGIAWPLNDGGDD